MSLLPSHDDPRRHRLYALKRAPGLRHHGNTALLHLLSQSQDVAWARGAVLCREGEPAEGFFVLLEGELEVLRGGEPLMTLQPCAPLGLEALSSGRSAFTVRAAVDSTGLFISKDAVAGLPRAAPGAPEQPRARAEVIAFESDVPGAPLSSLIELVAKVIHRDFGDRVLLLRTAPQRGTDVLVTKGADGVLRATLPPPEPGAPGLLPPSVLHRLTAEHGLHYVLLDGCGVADATLLGKTARLMPTLSARATPGHRVLPTVVVDPCRTPRESELSGQAPRPQWLPPCPLRLGMERMKRLRVDDRPLEATALRAAEEDALSRWARALTHRRVGLALSGGGVWGFYHVHLLRWLVGQGVPIDIISGSSMGSLVGAYFCANALDGKSGLEGLRRLEERAVSRQLSLAATAAILTTYSLERFVEQDLGRVCLESLPTRFLPVTTDLTRGDCVALEQGPVALAVRASGSAPGIWGPTVVPPARYVDGAFTSMVPAHVLLDAGADIIFSSNIFPFGVRHASAPRQSGLGRFLAGLNPVARALDLAASGVLLLHRSGDVESLLADVRYDIHSAEAPLLTAMEFTKARDILGRAAADASLAKRLEEMKQHWLQVKARGARAHIPRGGQQAA
ncbi:patatin-like phospholipase family protein [Corallococcus macrosporus]|uniref:Cyclic nucleotide-binding/patatin-like phospholipase domain-containing protein n=1 Tax=Myxococcus fulvus (strain ATCC BAA-855 / HW-1) TaxID=483219 RepID=F8CL29_MYXFH|nr:patatin-like phospholipase family protein [Corallococcus macrosporus]AEI63942.1 cyclic nucleotide-binding/patatin-like phospholipase domain-containing protein [Corallococcus macrosporus]